MNAREQRRAEQLRATEEIADFIAARLPGADPAQIAEQLGGLRLLPSQTDRVLEHLRAPAATHRDRPAVDRGRHPDPGP